MRWLRFSRNGCVRNIKSPNGWILARSIELSKSSHGDRRCIDMVKKGKALFEGEVICQECQKPNLVTITKERIKAPVKGEYKLRIKVEKVMKQATL